MLTGDSKRVADSVAAELGVDEVRSELLSGDKVVRTEGAAGSHQHKAGKPLSATASTTRPF